MESYNYGSQYKTSNRGDKFSESCYLQNDFYYKLFTDLASPITEINPRGPGLSSTSPDKMSRNCKATLKQMIPATTPLKHLDLAALCPD